MTPATDVTIAGAGLAGQVMALALARADGVDLTLRIVDAAPAGRQPDDIRAYAIAASARRMLAELGIWERVADRAEPCMEMRITDSRLEEIVRPVFLEIVGAARDGEPFVHFIDGRDLQAAVAAACDEAGLEVEYGFPVAEIASDTYGIGLDQGSAASSLLIGADGARSAVRRAAGIRTVGWDYDQGAIVAIVEHDVPHEGSAVQHFLPGGPFAMLPLANEGGNRSGVVWSDEIEAARRYAALPPEAFRAEVESRAGPEFGDIRIVEPPRVYPLELGLARAFVAPRIALIGDAAHRLHPLAGLGLNLGLRDIAALTEVVVDAARRGEDIGSLAVLERYQRWRRFDTVQVAAATDLINRLFSNDIGPLRGLRSVGLGLVDRMLPLKRAIIDEAAGDSGTPPRLMRGEPV